MTQAVTQTPHAGQDHPDSGHDDHNPHLAHHFDTMEQQYDTGKLGMWVFLATELLMFGGLFCAYSVYRSNNPEVFLYSASHLNTMWGAINTAVLLASSLTMAWAVRAAQLGQQKLLVTLCLATLLGGAGFMMIKAEEYNHKFHEGYGPGFMNRYNAFYKGEDGKNNDFGVKEFAANLQAIKPPPASHVGVTASPADPHLYRDPHAGTGDASKIVPVFMASGGLTAEQTVATDFKKAADGPGHQDAAANSKNHPQATPGAHDAEAGTPNGHLAFTDMSSQLDRQRVNTFFGIYYCMTGLHGIHVLVGMALIMWITYRAADTRQRAWLLPLIPLGIGAYFVFLFAINFVIPTPSGQLHVATTLLYTGLGTIAFGGLWMASRFAKAAKATVIAPGEFSQAYFAPVDLVGLYWHLVDLIWIFLFPLLYLIHGMPST